MFAWVENVGIRVMQKHRALHNFLLDHVLLEVEPSYAYVGHPLVRSRVEVVGISGRDQWLDLMARGHERLGQLGVAQVY